ncbi:hypothetical protein B0H16DRAFT_1736216 [Mycena metata]|uniref:Uncharacterized protein n=1 Tax=Mycena metata TaxID=1033252 RepID=A0AAD7HQZ7_9AGAR|nr:hypothetical protein B0H16DRAFT_1736216 [Mycena metata]
MQPRLIMLLLSLGVLASTMSIPETPSAPVPAPNVPRELPAVPEVGQPDAKPDPSEKILPNEKVSTPYDPPKRNALPVPNTPKRAMPAPPAPPAVPTPVAPNVPRELPAVPEVGQPDAKPDPSEKILPNEKVSTPYDPAVKRATPETPAPPAVNSNALPVPNTPKRATPAPPAAPAVPNANPETNALPVPKTPKRATPAPPAAPAVPTLRLPAPPCLHPLFRMPTSETNALPVPNTPKRATPELLLRPLSNAMHRNEGTCSSQAGGARFSLTIPRPVTRICRTPKGLVAPETIKEHAN